MISNSPSLSPPPSSPHPPLPLPAPAQDVGMWLWPRLPRGKWDLGPISQARKAALHWGAL